MPTVNELWSHRVASTPESLFLVVGANQRTFTYGEFDALVTGTAHGLRKYGVEAGDRVAYHLPNGVDMLRLELALQVLGAVSVPVITGSTPSEIAHVLAVSEPLLLVVDEPGRIAVEAIQDRSVVPDRLLTVGDGLPQLDSDNRRSINAPLDAMAPMSIRFTSGSTALPKGVVQPGAGFGTAGRAIADRLSIASSDRVLCAIPLFHTAGTNMLLAPVIVAGATFVLIPKFSRSRFWDEVQATGATVTMLMATQISMLMTDPPRSGDADNPLRIVITHNRSDEFNARFGVDTITMWAMTETSGIGTLTFPGQNDYLPMLVGTPTDDDAEIRIVDELGADLPTGSVGELLFRHPHAMLEYFNDPANTSLTLHDGWVSTGDLCKVDDDGRMYFCGRLKNLIKRGGENVSGEEVESVIASHPDVEEVVVCAVPDAVYAEEVYAAVSRRAGRSLTEAELVSYCAAEIVDWKVPRYVHLSDEPLPKLANGKTDRAAVARSARSDLTSAWDRR